VGIRCYGELAVRCCENKNGETDHVFVGFKSKNYRRKGDILFSLRDMIFISKEDKLAIILTIVMQKIITPEICFQIIKFL